MFTDYSQPRPRKAINDKLCQLLNQPVTGSYCGQSFIGFVSADRGLTTRPYDIELTIELTAPLTVFKATREPGEHILISAADLIRTYEGTTRFTTHIDGLTL